MEMKRERESQHRIAGLPFSLYPQRRLKLQPFNRATDPWAVLPPGSPGPLSPDHLPRGA